MSKLKLTKLPAIKRKKNFIQGMTDSLWAYFSCTSPQRSVCNHRLTTLSAGFSTSLFPVTVLRNTLGHRMVFRRGERCKRSSVGFSCDRSCATSPVNQNIIFIFILFRKPPPLFRWEQLEVHEINHRNWYWYAPHHKKMLWRIIIFLAERKRSASFYLT